MLLCPDIAQSLPGLGKAFKMPEAALALAIDDQCQGLHAWTL
jgi:hypothetical protein